MIIRVLIGMALCGVAVYYYHVPVAIIAGAYMVSCEIDKAFKRLE